MAKKKKVPASETPESRLTKEEKEQRQDTMAASGVAAERRQVDQRRELRLNMMRSIVTEPLLSQARENPAGNFDVWVANC